MGNPLGECANLILGRISGIETLAAADSPKFISFGGAIPLEDHVE
jgi:hypothetical protein